MVIVLSILTGCTVATDSAEAQAPLNPQHAQPAVKAQPFIKHYDGMTIKRDKLGIVTVDGKPAANDENTATASTYSSGLYTVVVYKKGKVAVMKEGRFMGYAK